MRQPKKECTCESTRENLDFLNEAVFWVAKDIIEHGRVLDLYAERIYSTEEACFWVDWEWGFKKAIETIKENQITDAENLSDAIDIIANLQKVDKLMLDIIVRQDEQIKDLEGKFDFHDATILVLFIIFLIWNLILTYNVFF